jgi:hypothetical protein
MGLYTAGPRLRGMPGAARYDRQSKREIERAVHMRGVFPAAVLAAVFLAGGCGGSGSGATQGARPADAAGAPALETRWLRGLWANDIRDALGTIGLMCKGPVMENRTNVWTCESGTPLVSYKVRFYGTAPGKIEYINAVVTQSGAAKDALPLRVFAVMAGLRFESADPAKAREWVNGAIAEGGTTVIGPAKYRLAGDANRRVFDIKASGSEW